MNEKYIAWQGQLKVRKIFRLFWSFWGFYGIFVCGCIWVSLLFWPGGGRLFFVALGAFIVARGIVCEIIYHFFPRSRPYQTYGFSPRLQSRWFSLESTDKHSFPSGHATGVSVLVPLCFAANFYLGVATSLTVVLVAIARVVLGFHYPKDVVAGVALGVAVSYVCLFLPL